MKKTYDFVFGLGVGCSCSQTLRKAGLQFLSLPFDWTGYTKNLQLYPGDMPLKVRDICAGMPDWFRREDISYVHRDIDNQDIPFNHRTTAFFPHDFHSPKELEENFTAVQAKYQRRIDRFLAMIERSRDLLIVRLEVPPGTPPTTDDDLRLSRRMFAERFPGKRFDLVHIRMEKGLPFRRRRVAEIEPGFTEIAFDYHDYTPGKPFYEVKLAETAAALKEVAAVRDYRTPEERRRGRWAAVRKFLHLG